MMDIDPKRVVIDKINKKVFNVDGSNFQLICMMMTSGIVSWEDNMNTRVQIRFEELIGNQ